MRHARPVALDRLETLIAALREIDGLVEKSRGVFYKRGRAFLHFHEDGEGLFADIRGDDDDFDRFEVTAPPAQRALLREARRKAQG